MTLNQITSAIRIFINCFYMMYLLRLERKELQPILMRLQQAPNSSESVKQHDASTTYQSGYLVDSTVRLAPLTAMGPGMQHRGQ